MYKNNFPEIQSKAHWLEFDLREHPIVRLSQNGKSVIPFRFYAVVFPGQVMKLQRLLWSWKVVSAMRSSLCFYEKISFILVSFN